MNVHITHEIVSRLTYDRKMAMGPGKTVPSDSIRKLKLSDDSYIFLEQCWFRYSCVPGPKFLSIKEIVKASVKDPKITKWGYLQIGHCPNGDSIYLRQRDFTVLYSSHDIAWEYEGDEKVGFEKSLFKVYNSVDNLLIHILQGDFIPWDSYSAREYYVMFDGR